MAELIKTWGDGSSLLVNYTGSGDGTITVSGDANSGEARSMELSVRAGSLVRSLTVKQVAKPMPAYTIYDYLVTDGKTCFATGYTPIASTSIAPVLGSIPYSSLNKDILIFCNGDVMDCYTTSIWHISHMYNKRAYYYQVSRKADADVYYRRTDTSYAKLTLAKMSDDFAFEDYTSYVNASSATLRSTTYKPLYILSDNAGNYARAGIKFYRLKIWESGEEVRNYVPAVDNSTGEIGLLDLVTQQFITPTTGSPTVGNI